MTLEEMINEQQMLVNNARNTGQGNVGRRDKTFR